MPPVPRRDWKRPSRRRVLAIRDRVGCGIVLIDHDVRLIMRTCERVKERLTEKKS